jgi:dienelactone hydrolase
MSVGMWILCLLVLFAAALRAQAPADHLPGTSPLAASEELSPRMVAGIDRALDRQRDETAATRAQFWRHDPASPAAYATSVAPNRARLQQIIGAVDERRSPVAIEYVGGPDQSALVAETERVRVFAVRWPVFEGVNGEGLLLEPKGRVRARIVALPDADELPEALAGMIAGGDAWALRLAESGCEVIVPALLDRRATWSGNPRIAMTDQTHREWIWRQSYELGRHPIGFEVQTVRAVLDAWAARSEKLPAGVAGYGEGGLIALYTAAIDPRVEATLVSGYFQRREELAREPIYRRVFGLLKEFGDAEIASLVAPRALVIEHSAGPRRDGPPAVDATRRKGAAPGVIAPPAFGSVRHEVERARTLATGVGKPVELVAGRDGGVVGPGSTPALQALRVGLGVTEPPIRERFVAPVVHARPGADARQQRRVAEWGEFGQRLQRRSEFGREALWQGTTPQPGGDWHRQAQPLRERMWSEVFGRLPDPSLPPNARSRKLEERPEYTIWEVTLDVWPEVFAWGYLLLPNGLKPGEKRPVVVTQHGLEGTPFKTINEDRESRDWTAYRAYARALAARGFIVFAPHNPYTGGEAFRRLQAKAHPLGLTLFSYILGQHQRMLEWLGSLPQVDAKRIGFYGISYGGLSALRLPALLDGYALSICSAAFNDWPRKIVSPEFRASYLFTAEHEQFSFNLGSTFGHAEMARLIAPRPFMVERGHRDGVAPDEWVAYEYAKVRRLYAQLGLPHRTEIEFFNGAHEIHGVGTFAFLHRHLDWPEPAARP